jgi:small-conductance mechanosensitive channel
MADLQFIRDNLLRPGTLPGAVFLGIVAILLAWLAGRAVHLAVNGSLDRAARDGADPTAIRFLGRLAKFIVYVLAFVCYAHVVPALQKLGTAWLASVGVVSVVVGLAAQSTLGNLIAGVSLVLYRPFKLGDRVQVSGPTGLETGVVESIDLGYTVLCMADKRRLVIPNNTMASQATVNLSLAPPRTDCGVSIRVALAQDIDRARQILLDLAKAQPNITQINGCFVIRVTRKGATLALNAGCTDPDAAPRIKSDLLAGAKKQFDAAGIQIG